MYPCISIILQQLNVWSEQDEVDNMCGYWYMADDIMAVTVEISYSRTWWWHPNDVLNIWQQYKTSLLYLNYALKSIDASPFSLHQYSGLKPHHSHYVPCAKRWNIWSSVVCNIWAVNQRHKWWHQRRNDIYICRWLVGWSVGLDGFYWSVACSLGRQIIFFLTTLIDSNWDVSQVHGIYIPDNTVTKWFHICICGFVD